MAPVVKEYSKNWFFIYDRERPVLKENTTRYRTEKAALKALSGDTEVAKKPRKPSKKQLDIIAATTAAADAREAYRREMHGY